MKKIGEDFRKMLSGLSYQNASDNLSRREKLSLLGDKSENHNVAKLNASADKVDVQKSVI